MKIVLLPLAALMSFGILATGYGSETDAEADPHYIFLGASLRASHRNQMLPVMATDGKRLLLDGSSGMKRVSFNVPCNYQPSVELSKGYMSVDEFSYDLDFRGKARMESALVTEMHRNSFQGELEISEAKGVLNNPSSTEAEKETALGRIDEIEEDTAQFESQIQDAIDHDRVGPEDMHDTLNARMTLMPSRDISNAYCAVVVNFEAPDPGEDGRPKARTVVRIRKVGDLLANVPEKFSCSVPFGQYQFEGAECDVYFFSGDGKGIATNLSKGLKKLTPDQLERYRKLAGE